MCGIRGVIATEKKYHLYLFSLFVVSAKKKNRFAPKKNYIIHITYISVRMMLYGSNNIFFFFHFFTTHFRRAFGEKKKDKHLKMAAQVDFYLIKVYLDTLRRIYFVHFSPNKIVQ